VIRPIRAGRPMLAAAGLLAAAVVTACGAGTQGAAAPAGSPRPSGSPAPSPSSAPPATASPAVSAAGPGGASAPCATSGLKATVLRLPGSATAGTEHFPIDFTNVSGASCVLFGYPGVSFVTRPGGSQIGPAAARSDVNSPASVSLAPGGTAYATLSMTDPGTFSASACRPVTARWLRVYPPNQTAAMTIAFNATVCTALPAGLGPQLAIAVIEPGNGRSHPEP
jgi:Protein of unknown function (DUF4232)